MQSVGIGCHRMFEREELPTSQAKITEAGKSASQFQRLRSPVALERVEPVQALTATELVREIAGPLMNVDRCVRPAHESSDPSVVDLCRARDPVKEIPDDRLCDRCPLGIAQHHAVDRQSLILEQALVRCEEERTVPDHRTSDVSPELVTLERRLCAGVEGIASIERSVPEEFDQPTMELIRSRTRDDVDAGAAVTSVIDLRRRIADPELFDRIDWRLKDENVIELIVERDAIHLEIRRALAVPGTIDRLAALSARRRGEGSGLRRRHGTGREQG